jgi:tetratricopeptide (TPR) repeat protein
LRTLRKEPDQRYRSVGDLSEDVRRYLESEPVRARRGTRSYRVGKFMRRHRNGVLAGAVALILLAGAVSALIREERRVARERDRAEAVAVFLVDMFRVPDLWTRIGQTITANEVLDNALTKLNTSPPDAPGARGTLLHSLGKIYFNLGLYTPAETLMTPALADLEAIHGKNHPILAEAYRDLAILHYQQGRYGEAERSLDRAIAIAQELPEKERPQASDTRLLLGHIAFARGNFSKAEQLFREAANLRTRTYGREHPAVASVLNDLGCALHEQGRFAEARELYQRSLEIRRKHFGEQHALVLQSLHNQARLDEDEGNFEAAEALYQTIFPSRQSFGYYNPTHTLLYQNMGSLFLSQGIYDQAGLRLDDTLSLRRRTFPDHHPDVARAAAELGRLAHALKRYDEAAPLYRDSYARLSSVLGPDHPDCLVVANNLAALLAETGKFRQAEALWQKLAQQASRRRLRPHILRTIEGNRALLHAATNEQPGHPEYRTIGLTMPSLTEPSQIVAPPPLDLLRDSRTNPEQSRILFADSFDDGVLDPAKWEYGGNVVVEEGGELRVLRTVTDSGGWARTRPILIDPQRPLIIRRKVKIFAANQYFDGSLSVDITGYPEKRFGLSYANYYYTGAGECVTVGFSLFRRDANTHRYADRQANASPLLPPIWGRWFEEELIYDPRSGELRYSTDGNLRLVYSVGSLPPKTSRITLSFATWGWYTGHYQKVDDLEVRQ